MNHVFYLTPRRCLLLIGLFILSVILHNLISALLGFEEALFLLIAVIILPAYTSLSLCLTIINHIRNRPKN